MRLHRHMLARISSVLLLAGAFVVVSAARADATLIIYVCNDAACSGGGDQAFVDGAFGDDDLATTGSVTFSIPNYATGGASSYDFLGSPAEPIITLNYSFGAAAFAGGATPYVYATQSGFTASGIALFEANASNGSGMASLHTGAGAFSPPFGAPSFSCALDCAAAGAGAVPPAPYYLAVGIAPTAGLGGGASGDATVTVPQQSVPDGGSTATLLGSVLLGFGMLRRKFKR